MQYVQRIAAQGGAGPGLQAKRIGQIWVDTFMHKMVYTNVLCPDAPNQQKWSCQTHQKHFVQLRRISGVIEYTGSTPRCTNHNEVQKCKISTTFTQGRDARIA